MKKKLTTVVAFAGFCLSPALAGESYGYCVAFSEANGLDASPCTCIEENVGDDAELLAEQAALETLEDFENASAELHEAIDPCISS